MLILSRQKGQWIDIDDEETGLHGRIVVVDIQGDKVRLGLDFPKNVQIVRPDANVKEKKKK